jgi:hypothetical protein
MARFGEIHFYLRLHRRLCVAKVNVQAETTVPALHVLGARPLGQMHCTIMLSKK